MIGQLKQTIKDEIEKALRGAGYELAPDFEVGLENTKDAAHGDFASNVAMQLARVAKKNPRMIAEDVIAHLNLEAAKIEQADIAGPGFINFFINKAALTQVINQITTEGMAYGKSTAGKNAKYNVEYVSVNPTGDLHLGHARGAAIGDSLCNLLETAGYDVVREYYINDAGNQIHNLVLSVYARYLEALNVAHSFPEEGYRGADIAAFGKQLADEHGDQFVDRLDAHYAYLRERSLTFEMDKIKTDLTLFKVDFDLYTSEQKLYDEQRVDTSIQLLKEKGYIYEQDGAEWLRSTDFGDDKDRVLKKSDGSFTYLTPDIANHIEKIKRGNDKLINIWGADHHGYIARVKAAIQALGYDAHLLEVDIIQMVRLLKDGKEFKMSKRTGKAVTLRELVEEVGVDATRYFFASRSAESPMDFDLDLAIKQSNENPVYYVQYAHARACTLLTRGKEQGFTPAELDVYNHLTHEKELDVIKRMGDFPAVIADAAAKRKPHLVVNYIHDLVSAFHSLYGAKKFINTDDPSGTAERLALVNALRMTIHNALALIGVSAPVNM
ncbi:MAG: arginine--tRNA ligase [Defluviitaleaceae bacterium]|nr:arginine--tRNA ligase [Defluviitaleaceae bacterium]